LLAPFGRANTVSPSETNSGYWLTASQKEVTEALASRTSHRLVDPETIAQKIAFLASEEAKHITGENFEVSE
jgi:3-oxoacyl-[acyl-carrier protein] reductase